ncbi:beta-galactosidase trimerization domain-containing protein [Streptomyces sp. B93]|uniref:beta-galactosidase trimerization domain-containing protein n=1 Tax=Streptomyces sp. B93 TaxID=2824875 RepID=UPI0035A8A0D3
MAGETPPRGQPLGAATLGERTPARTALVFDWDSWWALETPDGPSRLVRYLDVVHAHYRAAREAGADVDVVPHTTDVGHYDVAMAPALYMIKGDLAHRLETEARLVFEIVRLTGAEAVATYGTDFYAGTPAVTRNRHGAGGGEAWYVATVLDQRGVDRIARRVLSRHGLLGRYADHRGVETATRIAADGTPLLFLLNHAPAPASLTAAGTAVDLLTGKRLERGGPLTLDPYGVAVLHAAQ